VLELGAGTALPGLLCAKVGAKKVYLSDEAEQANTIKNISEAVNLNSLQEKVESLQLTFL
jgi:predicted nicotinamide N-methyase